MPTLPPDAAALLASQRGVATSPQLNAVGLSDRRIATAVRHGLLIRLHRGAYALAEVWNAASDKSRHCLRLLSVQRATPDAVGWGPTAATAWGLPVRPLPHRPIVARPPGFVSAAGATVRRQVTSPEDVVRRFDLLVTSLPVTVVDVAAAAEQANALMTIDAALRSGLPLNTLFERAYRRSPQQGRRAILAALEVADPGSESGLESLSRGRCLDVGLPRPLCNVVLRCGGRSARVDMLWVEHGVPGECDGKQKYAKGDEAPTVIWKEKRRHEWIEAIGFEVARWGYPEVANNGNQMRVRVDRAMEIQRALCFGWPSGVTAEVPMPRGVVPHPWVVAEVKRLRALGYPISVVDDAGRSIVP
jgi:hypothetical protein